MTQSNSSESTLFTRLGGRSGITRIVDRFYDLMDIDPAYADLRAMHHADLNPMRTSLAGFLTAWVGGPRDWFVEHPNKCMMSAHAGLGITRTTADQWRIAMAHALNDCAVDADLATPLNDAFEMMASSMASAA